MGKVKAQLLDEQEQHDLFMRDQEPDFDDYALATRMVIAKEKDDQREMEAVFMEGEYCQTCEHCEKTKDPYGTGDSPTVRECLASPDQCPGVMK